MTEPPRDIWDRLAKMHNCCDVKVESRVHNGPDGVPVTTWTITIRQRKSWDDPIRIEAETMLDALVEGVLAAESRTWIQ
jgi:hypothetical protein